MPKGVSNKGKAVAKKREDTATTTEAKKVCGHCDTSVETSTSRKDSNKDSSKERISGGKNALQMSTRSWIDTSRPEENW